MADICHDFPIKGSTAQVFAAISTPEGLNSITQVVFRHSGWPQENEHYRISCYCWAMYLRHLKRYVESGETVVYEERLDV